MSPIQTIYCIIAWKKTAVKPLRGKKTLHIFGENTQNCCQNVLLSLERTGEDQPISARWLRKFLTDYFHNVFQYLALTLWRQLAVLQLLLDKLGMKKAHALFCCCPIRGTKAMQINFLNLIALQWTTPWKNMAAECTVCFLLTFYALTCAYTVFDSNSQRESFPGLAKSTKKCLQGIAQA